MYISTHEFSELKFDRFFPVFRELISKYAHFLTAVIGLFAAYKRLSSAYIGLFSAHAGPFSRTHM